MHKHFANKNTITPQKLLLQYQNYIWSTHPGYNGQRQTFYQLYGQCEQSDQYKNYEKEIAAANKKMYELKVDIHEIECNQQKIIIMNSKEQYYSVLNKLRSELANIRYDCQKKENNPPTSKKDILKTVFQAMEKGRLRADSDMVRRRQDQRDRCTCDGMNCEC